MLESMGILLFLMLLAVFPGCSSKSVRPALSGFELKESGLIVEAIPSFELLHLSEPGLLTRELPSGELALIRRLNSERKFGLLALDASPVEMWLAMEELLKLSAGAETWKSIRLKGMPDDRQTAEMEDWLAFVKERSKVDDSFYLAGFKPSLGVAMGWKNLFLSKVLIEALRGYGVEETSESMSQKIEALQWVKGCAKSGYPRNAGEIGALKNAIDSLRGWIRTAAPRASERYPNLPHGKLLSLIPISFDYAVKSCLSKQNPKVELALENDFIRAIRGVLPEDASFALMEDTARFRLRSVEMKRRFKGGVFGVGVVTLTGEGIMPGSEPKRTAVPPGVLATHREFSSLKSPRFILTRSSQGFDALLVFPKVSPTRKWFLDHLIKN